MDKELEKKIRGVFLKEDMGDDLDHPAIDYLRDYFHHKNCAHCAGQLQADHEGYTGNVASDRHNNEAEQSLQTAKNLYDDPENKKNYDYSDWRGLVRAAMVDHMRSVDSEMQRHRSDIENQ